MKVSLAEDIGSLWFRKTNICSKALILKVILAGGLFRLGRECAQTQRLSEIYRKTDEKPGQILKDFYF
jgi:hypothetical protein